MTRTEFCNRNLTAEIVALIDRRDPSPLFRLTLVGTAADASDHEAVWTDSIERHAARAAVSIVGTAVIQDNSSFSVYVLATDRRVTVSAADLAEYATTWADLVATYGAPAVVAKVQEIHYRDTLREWQDWQNGLTPHPPRKYARKAGSLPQMLSLAGIELAGLAVWG